MNKIKRFALSLAALLLFSSVAAAAPVSAKESSNDATTTNQPAETEDKTTPLPQSEAGHSSLLEQQLKTQAKAKLDAERQNLKLHTEAERQKACTERKTSLTTRMSNAVNEAKRHKSVFDNVYSKVKAFHDAKQLNVTNYTALVNDTDLAQTNAQSSIDALSSLNVTIDCTSPNAAETVADFQQAVKNSRDSLKTYRTAIADLIKAIKAAASTTGDSSTNGTAQ